jgi:general secretion pathway protein K
MSRVAGARSGGARGIALVLVLWVITLMTVMALGLTAAQRTEMSLIRNQVDGARFRALADAAVNYAFLNLIMPPALEMDAQVEAWVPDGVPRVWRFAGETLEIEVFNEASRIDLNRASRDTLESLLLLSGVDSDGAASLVDAIIDWRDEDDLTSLQGAEDGDYRAAGFPYGAKDGPFDSVAELQQVIGMAPDLYRRLAPALTVDADSEQVDETFASALVLAAHRGLTIEEAEEELRWRSESVVPGAEIAGRRDRGGPLYRIRVTWRQEGRAGRAMETLVSSPSGGARSPSIGWRRTGLQLE